MSGEHRKQSRVDKLGGAALFSQAFLKHFHKQVDESQALLEQLKSLLISVQENLNTDLGESYQAHKELQAVANVKLKENLVSGQRVSEDFASEAVTGSLRQVLSVLFLVNDQQKQLFAEIDKVKLQEIMNGIEQPLAKNQAEEYAAQVGQLVENLINLQKGLKHDLTLIHGKPLENESKVALNQERARLDQILLEQIKLNTSLKAVLSNDDVKNVQKNGPGQR